MAGSDPKTSRALEQTSARNDIDAEEDPLVELARIVSEDNAFGMAKPEKPKPTRPAPMSRPSLEDGLEAELLQELESSFAVREPPAPPPPRPTAVRSNAAPAPSRAPVAPARQANADPDPDELLRSIEEQLGQFERRHGGRFGAAPSSVSEPPVAEETAPDWDEPVEERPGPTFGAPSAESRRGSRIRPFAESTEPSEVAPEPAPVEELPSLSAARSDYRFRGPASANWDPVPREDYASEMVRDAFEETEPSPSAATDADDLFTQADAEAALARAEAAVARGRVEEERSPEAHRQQRIAATFPEFEEEPVTERSQPDLAGLEAGLSRELEPEYSDASPADKWRDDDAPAEESRVAAAIAPGPSRRAAAARAAADRGRSRMGLLTAAGVILVVLIGAGTALYLRSSEEGAASSPPPVIAADEGAVRVEPTQDQAATDGETVGDAVYNRVAGAAPETEEQMVESAEEPKEVARIVLPPSQTPDEQAATSEDAAGGPPATAESALTDAAAATEDEIGPRRVPTFVVRADGSIVETSAASTAAPNPAAAQNEQLASETVPIEPTPVPTVAIAEASAEGEGLPRPTPPAETEAPAAVDMTPRPSIDEQPAEVAAAEPEIAEPPLDLAPPPTAAEATASGEPGTLANAAPEAATPAPAEATSGGYLVQLSAQRSMDQAQSAYAAAQGQFPSVLGSLSPQIQEANLGEKGIYFRVRVGPWASRDEAIGVCESLKAAGGSCFVTQ